MTLNKQEQTDIHQLIGRLQKADGNYSKLCKRLKIIYWVFIPLFTLIALFEFWETKETNDLIVGLCLPVAFLIFAILFGSYQKEYNTVDYALPTLIMLKKAASRYHPFRKKNILIVPIFFLFDIHLILKYPNNYNTLEAQLLILLVVSVSMLIGLIVWYFKYKSLRDNALKIIKELEE